VRYAVFFCGLRSKGRSSSDEQNGVGTSLQGAFQCTLNFFLGTRDNEFP
jgi:hypothetical protein